MTQQSGQSEAARLQAAFAAGAYAEIQGARQWVNWRFEMLGGKLKKVPYQPRNGFRASANKPESWGTLVQALKRVELGYAQGIGFMVSEADPFCLIDLDERQSQEQHRITSPLGVRLFRYLNTITEFSPRYGLHFIVRLDRPVQALKSDVEVYYTGRFMTITANLVPDSLMEIATRQKEVEALIEAFRGRERQVTERSERRPGQKYASAEDWGLMDSNHFNDDAIVPYLSDEEILKKAKAAKNASKFLELWEGRWIENGLYMGDQSRADLQLVKFLLYWTNNHQAQTNRLFEQSALMRSKWRERVNSGGAGHSYGEVTIHNALRYRQVQEKK